MLTLVRPDVPVPGPRAPVGAEPSLRASYRSPERGARTVASDAGVNAEYAAMAWVSDDGRWWACRERPGPTQFAELVALAAAVSHHPGQRLRMLTDLDALAGLVSGWRAGGVHRWPSLHRCRDARVEGIVAVLQRRVAARAGRHDEVTAKHVRGHAGHPLNTAADRLARHALVAPRIDPRRCQEIVDHYLRRDPAAVGHPHTRLVVLSGGDASARDDVARAVRRRFGPTCALISRDDLAHVVLGDRDQYAGALLARTAAFALDSGQHVLCEGPLHSARERAALDDLADRHRGVTRAFRLGGPRVTTDPRRSSGVAELVLGPDFDEAVERIGDTLGDTERRK